MDSSLKRRQGKMDSARGPKKDVGDFDQPPPVETKFVPKIDLTSGFKRKKPLRFMKTRDISFYFERKSYLKAFLREMLIFIGFMITVILVSNKESIVHKYYYVESITGIFVKHQLDLAAGGSTSFMKISVMDVIWQFVDSLKSRFYWRTWYFPNNTRGELDEDDANILYENKMIGLARMRQVRVRQDSCKILDEFKDMFDSCYSEYSEDVESKEPYGPGNTSAWTYSSQETLGHHRFAGHLSTYGGGGYYMDFNLTHDISTYTIGILKENEWIDQATRLIIFEFTLYNANINYFCFVKLAFELLPTGGVLPSYRIISVRLMQRINYWDYILLLFQAIFVAYVSYYMFEEMYEIFYFRCFYFKMCWNWLDIFIILVGWAALGLYGYQHIYLKSHWKELVKTTEKHPVFDDAMFLENTYSDTINFLVFLCFLKLLKYLSLSHSMYQMQTTLARATKDIVNFSIIFFVVFIAFAQLGHYLFGSEVKSFRTLLKSFFALLRTIVGDFDYEAIEHAEPTLGPIYFFAFIFFVYFILMNMFLAIIIDNYSQVRYEVNAAGQQLHVVDLIENCFIKMLRIVGLQKLASKRALKAEEDAARAAYTDIRNLLHKCGFSEVEIDLFFSKYDITEDKLVQPDEIRNLLSNLENIPVTMPQVQTAAVLKTDQNIQELTGRIEVLEDAVLNANTKIDIILNKVDEMQELRMGRRID